MSAINKFRAKQGEIVGKNKDVFPELFRESKELFDDAKRYDAIDGVEATFFNGLNGTSIVVPLHDETRESSKTLARFMQYQIETSSEITVRKVKGIIESIILGLTSQCEDRNEAETVAACLFALHEQINKINNGCTILDAQEAEKEIAKREGQSVEPKSDQEAIVSLLSDDKASEECAKVWNETFNCAKDETPETPAEN